MAVLLVTYLNLSINQIDIQDPTYPIHYDEIMSDISIRLYDSLPS